MTDEPDIKLSVCCVQVTLYAIILIIWYDVIALFNGGDEFPKTDHFNYKIDDNIAAYFLSSH